MFRPYAALVDGEIEYHGTQAAYLPDPIAIGAVGGSGTRVLAKILADAGICMATPSNEAHDALEWPPMKHIIDSPQLQNVPMDVRMRAAFWGLEHLLYMRREKLKLSGRAGWKVPATHLWLAELAAYFPALQYIHIIRNGLDMAYSGNQRQLAIWGADFGINTHLDQNDMAPPEDALEYWLLANEKALARGQQLGERFLLVRFEDLCRQPRDELQRIFSFIGLEVPQPLHQELADRIHVPSSLNRYRHRNWRRDFTPGQLQRLEALGYIAQDHA